MANGLSVLPQNDLGEKFGSGLGNGLGGMLSYLAENKLRNMTQQKETHRIADYLKSIDPNLSEKEAYGLAGLGEKAYLPFLERLGYGENQGQNLEQMMGGLQNNELMEDQSMQQNPQQMGGYQSPLDMVRNFLSQAQGSQPTPQEQIQPSLSRTIPQPSRNRVAEVYGRGSPKEQLEREKLGLQEYKIQKDTIKQITDSYKASNKAHADLDVLEELTKKGDLSNPRLLVTLNKFGIPLEILQNPSNELYEKVFTNFIGNARNIFGARVTNYELQTFLKALPNLTQSKEGRLAVIKILKNEAHLSKKRFDLMQQMRSSNNGRLPLGFESNIEEKVGGLADTYADELKEIANNISKNKGKSQSGIPKLPSAAENKGKILKNSKTGKRVQSNGINWVVI